MRNILLFACIVPLTLLGCGGQFAANQARRQGARSADYYLKKYAEPEARKYYGDTPQTREQAKQARKELGNRIIYGK